MACPHDERHPVPTLPAVLAEQVREMFEAVPRLAVMRRRLPDGFQGPFGDAILALTRVNPDCLIAFVAAAERFVRAEAELAMVKDANTTGDAYVQWSRAKRDLNEAAEQALGVEGMGPYWRHYRERKRR